MVHGVTDRRTGQETGLWLERRCDCKAAVMEAGGGGRKRQVRCQTAAVAGRRCLQAVTHAGTPCCSHAVGEGRSVQQLRGEARLMGGDAVCMDKGLLCTNHTVYVCRMKQK